MPRSERKKQSSHEDADLRVCDAPPLRECCSGPEDLPSAARRSAPVGGSLGGLGHPPAARSVSGRCEQPAGVSASTLATPPGPRDLSRRLCSPAGDWIRVACRSNGSPAALQCPRSQATVTQPHVLSKHGHFRVMSEQAEVQSLVAGLGPPERGSGRDALPSVSVILATTLCSCRD